MGLFGGSRSNLRDSCEKNPNTGEVTCKRVRVNPDGTEVELAGFTKTVDANCNVSSSNEFENEDGQLRELESKFGNKFKAVCNKNVPPEY
jgi:hypothetical protein